jgi:ATP-dependent RNA helicase DDX52/ROK1
MLSAQFKPPILVFVSSKERARALHAELKHESVHVDSIHADQSRAARAAAITSFRKGATWVLITTDLLARGMDFLGVQTVINYDFPRTKTDYIHRCPDTC